ncbi:MAG: ABC transporter substrate-binding protein [candidate division Zixibacteria bacterium]|nr:ABC transporter substrate-binding protein [candidate division Zixibacteria bacterium]
MNELFRKALVLTVICVLFLACDIARASENLPIAIVTHDSLTSTIRTLKGARKVITRDNPEVSFHTFLITDDANHNQNIADSVVKIGPRVILTVGSSATEFAQSNFANVPVVFSAVKYPVLSCFVESMDRPGRNITGASLDIPVKIQFTYFKMIVPNLRKVGVLYTNNTADLIPQARVIARKAGLELIPALVDKPTELPPALDSLASIADGLWSVADPNLFNPQSTRYILLNTLRKGIPFMGFSRHVVESGALFALDFDYKAIGLQAGFTVNRIIKGEKPKNIPITLADIIWFHYNEKTAERINITIPEELMAVAKEVYR